MIILLVSGLCCQGSKVHVQYRSLLLDLLLEKTTVQGHFVGKAPKEFLAKSFCSLGYPPLLKGDEENGLHLFHLRTGFYVWCVCLERLH